VTLIESSSSGQAGALIEAVARAEQVTAEAVRAGLVEGTIVIPANRHRTAARPCGIGRGLRVKVNANIGTSGDYADVEAELTKLKAAVEAGADAIMDLSTGGDVAAIRRRLLAACPVPFGSVPVYDAVAQHGPEKGLMRMTADDFLRAFAAHAQDGVDFFVVHAGVTREALRILDRHPRVCGIVSRGGTMLSEWMRYHDRENPLYERFDEVLDIAREHEVTLSLGDGLRPGCLADSFDRAQVYELGVQAELHTRALATGVQSMIEGPGHVPLNQVAAQVELEKAVCRGAPFFVLGPLVTDVAPGYDHITSAIGAAVAAAAGADFLCYVTASEHLALPGAAEVREAVMASRIAAHAGDVARGRPGAADWDRRFAALRARRDWAGQLDLCLDPERARRLRDAHRPSDEGVCSMCGEFCVFKLAERGAEARKAGRDRA
jgi:phosphomethylpyrimidine synthase